LALLLWRLAYAYATHEQLPTQLAAHSSALRLPPCTTNLSGTLMLRIGKKPSPPLPHGGSASFRRHPCPNLPALQSAALAGSNPSRQLHAGAGAADTSQYPYAPQVPYALHATDGHDASVAHADAVRFQLSSWNLPEPVTTYRVGAAPSETVKDTDICSSSSTTAV
jgi:hypothetical protein